MNLEIKNKLEKGQSSVIDLILVPAVMIIVSFILSIVDKDSMFTRVLGTRDFIILTMVIIFHTIISALTYLVVSKKLFWQNSKWEFLTLCRWGFLLCSIIILSIELLLVIAGENNWSIHDAIFPIASYSSFIICKAHVKGLLDEK